MPRSTGCPSTVGTIDTAQLAKSFDVLSAAFANTPKSVHAALTGLSALSHTISSRDEELKLLAANTAAITGTLAGSNAQFAALINDGALLLQELQARSAAITACCTGPNSSRPRSPASSTTTTRCSARRWPSCRR